METLFKQLKDYAGSEIYPYHMPGHKRWGVGELSQSLAELDITEIEGFDNLHQPEGIIRQLQQCAAAAYGAEEAYYLVGGSTCGILSAVSAAIPQGGRLLIARNCHKSIYHAAYLRQLSLSYLYPKQVPDVGISEAVSPEQVRETLEREPDIDGVLIVSPTYEGRIADVEQIAGIVHSHGIPLIVDEAHGAHLGFHPSFAPGSSRAGADLVVVSLHKTLPAMTQTALLQVNGSLVDRRMIRRFLRIYQSSSPSYVLMASIDNAIRLAREQGDALFGEMVRNWNDMLGQLSACRALTIWPTAALSREEYQRHQDIGKLVVSVKDTGITGQELYRELLERYALQLEMACDSYVLAMFTVGDTPQGYQRLTRALLEIDSRLRMDRGIPESHVGVTEDNAGAAMQRDGLPLWESWDRPAQWTALQDAVGRYVAEYINIYPPGSPILVPGERMEEADRILLERYLAVGLNVQGISPKDGIPGVMVLTELTEL